MNDHESAYAGLVDVDTHDQWAFGTGFDDPLAGVDLTFPAGIDGTDLATYCLMLGDDALIAAQRLAEWNCRAPELEEEVALANIGLDLLGQARLLLARAAAADPGLVPVLPSGSPVPAEDALAFFRDGRDFRNVCLVEADNGDFAVTVFRLLVFATFRLAVLQRLRGSSDPVLAAVADKGAKEVTYHRDYAARWLIALSLGTPESRRRTELALHTVWPFVAELFATHPVEARIAAAGAGVDPATIRPEFDAVLAEVLDAAALPVPETRDGVTAGRGGMHTDALVELLAEMQCVARAHPSARW
ncbi:phenylacetate-CoA oxygenase subunit PaaI [Mycobacterium intermedium]|uniref:Phenylacetate-CoA oxygenase subunit PaaI n=1 Tax=Mycobacterium intermedium TaxID=28445 RepID=A0A1E3S628_MYCIE|nr:1,2-phenylacetyl-CoA epoxidase subunit PaaC [Mycobacterium intermedium]MCV6963614.1 phenylacetate-CoA oxygenase subunit PaaC [Mycobacterium intermedium]ODQ97616.1 phenylacetate-CoA oxygenase subunit PaaI [Mycobacterium intermedium]OPE46967.1 phenylacetate-CoA oxygenase subunit PaaI [Mycobacterium intermedium]ORB09622.1 phenylacetate-CoA oxygenase subunit PaaI [Mycobacterium intermedium]